MHARVTDSRTQKRIGYSPLRKNSRPTNHLDKPRLFQKPTRRTSLANIISYENANPMNLLSPGTWYEGVVCQTYSCKFYPATCSLVILNVPVSRENMALELLWVAVPELSRLAVQWACTGY